MSNSLVVRKNSGNSLTILKSGSLSAIASLPPATNTTLGGIIVGDNLTITGNGVLSAQPGGVTAFNNRTGNVSLTSNDVTSALTYTPLTSTTPYGNMSFTGTSADSPFNLRLSNSNGSRTVGINSSASNYVYGNGTVVPWGANLDVNWVIINPRANGQVDTYYPFLRLFTDRSFPDVNEAGLGLYYNYTPNATTGPYYNSSLRVYKTKLEFFASSYTWTDNSVLTRFYADTRYLTSANLTPYLTTATAAATYLTSANLTYANLTGTPTTLAGYGITDGLTSANLTPYLTTANATATYAVLGHTHAIANVTGLQTALDAKLESANFTYSNLTGKPSTFAPSAHTHSISEVTGLQTALDAKLPSANFTYANLTGTPNLTLYLTTANASSTYQPLGNYATTSCLTFSNITGKPTTLSGYGITDGYSTSNPSGYITAGANTFTGSQNLQDNELIRAKLRDYSETVSSPTISAGTLVLNLETSNIFTVSLNAAITTLTISNPPASGSGGSFTLIFTADGTARAVTWPASIKWAGGTAPTLTSTSGKVDSFAFFSSDGGTTWQGYVGGQNF
jgi:uncharacterized protein YjbI with pentapeptide repeats